jgi:sRNA-binding protein
MNGKKPAFRLRKSKPFTAAELRAQAWLEAVYPQVFGPKIRVLARGVRQEILADPRRPDDVSKSALRTMIRWRALNPDYLKRLAQPGARRFSLNGRVVEAVTAEHAEAAKRTKARQAKASRARPRA